MKAPNIEKLMVENQKKVSQSESRINYRYVEKEHDIEKLTIGLNMITNLPIFIWVDFCFSIF